MPLHVRLQRATFEVLTAEQEVQMTVGVYVLHAVVVEVLEVLDPGRMGAGALRITVRVPWGEDTCRDENKCPLAQGDKI
ncbi:hypothetical protein DPMN_122536 [Dreissena polymorpha]|uniref:Uncharacterized protein n=1 Tax=Dreissena polymorpha TaxID=45954 RepID=A0A9D4GVQ5_DREPO|nr:hypothetical protein DPMN_122536 [Dreissena polymorpha]